MLGHAAVLQSPERCLQSAAGSLLGAEVTAEQIVCSSARCNRSVLQKVNKHFYINSNKYFPRFVSGPMFCRSPESGRYHVASLPVASGDWCAAGASTSLAAHRGWIQRTIEYLDSSYADTVTDILERDAAAETEQQQQEEEEEEEENNTCAKNPCGAHALCWNGDGNSYLCTCAPEYPHGNLHHYHLGTMTILTILPMSR